MRRFIVETFYTDGMHCERHRVDAASVEDAVELALEQAGTADDWWTVVECGPTEVDSVVEIIGENEIVHQPRAKAADPLSLDASVACELANALRGFVSQFGNQASAELLHGALQALAQASPGEGSRC